MSMDALPRERSLDAKKVLLDALKLARTSIRLQKQKEASR